MRDLDMETTQLQETGETRLRTPTLSEIETICDRLGLDGDEIRLSGDAIGTMTIRVEDGREVQAPSRGDGQPVELRRVSLTEYEAQRAGILHLWRMTPPDSD